MRYNKKAYCYVRASGHVTDHHLFGSRARYCEIYRFSTLLGHYLQSASITQSAGKDFHAGAVVPFE